MKEVIECVKVNLDIQSEKYQLILLFYGKLIIFIV